MELCDEVRQESHRPNELLERWRMQRVQRHRTPLPVGPLLVGMLYSFYKVTRAQSNALLSTTKSPASNHLHELRSPVEGNGWKCYGIVWFGLDFRVKKTAFTLRFSNQWPLKELYNAAKHSPVHAHIHTPTAESTPPGQQERSG